MVIDIVFIDILGYDDYSLKRYSDCSLAELYDPLTMPIELQKAHTANDKAVMQAYGFSIKETSEWDCVTALMKMYQALINREGHRILPD